MTAIPELIQKVDEVIEFGKSTPAQNRAAVAAALLSLQNYRSEFPFIRLTSNQELQDSDSSGSPDSWIFGANIDTELVDTISYSRAWASRSALEKEFMTAAGVENVVYWNAKDVNIWRLSWDVAESVITAGGAPTFLMYQNVGGFTSMTYKAITKLESGIVKAENGGLFTGITSNAAITGKISTTTQRAFGETGSIKSPAGSLLIALPAAVSGVHPDSQWGFFSAKSSGII